MSRLLARIPTGAKDRAYLLGTLAGTAGFALAWPPAGLLFLSAASFGLVALAVIAEVRRGPGT